MQAQKLCPKRDNKEEGNAMQHVQLQLLRIVLLLRQFAN